MGNFSLSANIENGFAKGTEYISTPNAIKVAQSLVYDYATGIHSFTIIGSYGTGKSSFLLALEEDLKCNKNKERLLISPDSLIGKKKVEILNIVGDYKDLSTLIGNALNIDSTTNVLDELRAFYNKLKSQNKFLLIVIDEFGKVLEHAAEHNPEQELYLIQKLAEFINMPQRSAMLITTLHQNFNSYARKLNEAQKNEWTKVKGRFKDIVFVEPIEQVMYLAAKRHDSIKEIKNLNHLKDLQKLCFNCKYVAEGISEETLTTLYPLDPFAAYSITKAIERYGQNERSLFSFMESRGSNSVAEFEPENNLTYNLSCVYDYVIQNFYSYLKDANADSMQWSAINVAMERAETVSWSNEKQHNDAINIIKAIGIMNILGNGTYSITIQQMAGYAENAMAAKDAIETINKLISKNIVRFAEYKQRLILFEGTDVDIEEEIRKATLKVPRSTNYIDNITLFFNKRITPVKAHFYHKGTPRYFDYLILSEVLDILPTGDTDGYIELIFSEDKRYYKDVLNFSRECEHAILLAYFKNTEKIIEHIHNIDIYDYIINKVLIDHSDRVAITEINRQKEYEEIKLNKTINDDLYSYSGNVVWIFKGKEVALKSYKDFNRLLSEICDEIYYETPVMNNELFNKHKLSGSISSAKGKFLTALVENSNLEDLGFDKDKFPPEKTIYNTLLKNTGLHTGNGFADAPSNPGFNSLWKASEDFLHSTVNKPRKISELIKTLSQQPYKLKQGFIDFWIPTYLFIKRQDFSLFQISNDRYLPNVNIEFFELLQKHPNDFQIKAFAIDGVKLDFFNQYRKFINLGNEFEIKTDKFLETIKPFLFFYNRLNIYAKTTRKFNHPSTLKFRDILANAKDPEKTFFEDLPEALGYDKLSLKKDSFIEEYGKIIQIAIKELRGCYNSLIDRIERRLIDGLGLESEEYAVYSEDIRNKLSNVKSYLLTDKQKEFLNHAVLRFDSRTEWYQSICYAAIDQPLEELKDEQEEQLVDELLYLFRECEKYYDISKIADRTNKDDKIFAFEMVSNKGDRIKNQTFVLTPKEEKKAKEMEKKISEILSGNSNTDICTLLYILQKKLGK